MPSLNLNSDQLLSTTRAVRKRLDFSRPVEPEIIRECIEMAIQAPTGSNTQRWHFIVVTDSQKKMALADLYRQGMAAAYGNPERVNRMRPQDPEQAATMDRVMSSSQYLAEHMQDVPVMIIPCIQARLDGQPANVQAGAWGSILPAVWSFMLAARDRGLGTVWTTLHLSHEKEAAEILGIPYQKYTQAALIPLAYTLGTDFKPGPRKPLDEVIHWEKW